MEESYIRCALKVLKMITLCYKDRKIISITLEELNGKHQADYKSIASNY